MAFFVETNGKKPIVFLVDEVGASEMDRIVETLTKLRENRPEIELDLSRLPDLAWGTLGKLVEYCKRAREAKTHIRVLRVNPGLSETIRALGVAQYLGMDPQNDPIEQPDRAVC